MRCSAGLTSRAFAGEVTKLARIARPMKLSRRIVRFRQLREGRAWMSAAGVCRATRTWQEPERRIEPRPTAHLYGEKAAAEVAAKIEDSARALSKRFKSASLV